MSHIRLPIHLKLMNFLIMRLLIRSLINLQTNYYLKFLPNQFSTGFRIFVISGTNLSKIRVNPKSVGCVPSTVAS